METGLYKVLGHEVPDTFHAGMEVVGAIGTFAGLAMTAGHLYGKLSTLAYQIQYARDQILRLGQDVSGIEAAINQLLEVLKDPEFTKVAGPENKSLRLIQNLQISCQSLFDKIEDSLKKANKQIRAKGISLGVQITLTRSEQALWPFRYDQAGPISRDLDGVKSTLILVAQMTTLSLVKKMSAK